jgi:hypothetical protein
MISKKKQKNQASIIFYTKIIDEFPIATWAARVSHSTQGHPAASAKFYCDFSKKYKWRVIISF